MPSIIIKLNPDICTERLKAVLQDAIQFASEEHCAYLTPEHLLACLTDDDVFVGFCESNGIDSDAMYEELCDFVDQLDKLPEDDNETAPDQTLGFEAVIGHLQKSYDKRAFPANIPDMIFAMNSLYDHHIAYIVDKYMGQPLVWFKKLLDAYHEDVFEAMSKGLRKKYPESNAPAPTSKEMDSMIDNADQLINAIGSLFGSSVLNGSNGGAQQQSRQKEPWEDYLTCVSETYKTHNPLIGREAELERTLQILCRKEKNNPLHIGEAGVGKTALIYGLAAKMAKGEVPEKMRGYTIYMCDMGALMAGTSYHGELEKRIKMMMDGMKQRGKCILYIDEIHSIMGKDSSGGGQPSIANLLKPYLEDGSVKFIGSTTYQEYNRNMAKDKGIARRFQQIDILEPSVEETIEIVNGVLPNFEKHHGVKFDADAVRYAVEKSHALIADRYLPDKALDIIDEAGAYRQLHPLKNKKGETMSAGRQKVDRSLVADIMAKVCKINAKALTEEDNAALKELDERISSEIYGQDDAVKKVVRAVKMAKAGLIPTDKPLASLLFVGPTGVGKTEVCKVLAKQLGIELVRFDMSEYTEKHTVAKLIGSPAGYVGYDDGGLLTDAIRKNPNCVLLLDEIEKAHQDIYNILLQVMDYARLTDNKGNKVDFKNVILIMTSNAGAQFAAQAAVGFAGGQTRGEAMMQTVKKTFKPEFLNRLSGTVVFRDMDVPMATLILDKKLRQLSAMLAQKSVTMTLTEDAHKLLLDKGFTLQYGAREMDRVIQNMLTPLLMDEILFGSLVKGGDITIDRDGDVLKAV